MPALAERRGALACGHASPPRRTLARPRGSMLATMALSVVLSALLLSLYAAPACADTAASLQIIQGCLDAGASAPPAAPKERSDPRLTPISQTVSAQPEPQTPRQRPGDTDLTARCPQLARALAELGFSAQLSTWNGRLDRGALEDLLRVARRYAGSTPSSPPQLTLLPSALARLQVPVQPRRSWWQALKERLRQWLDQPQDAREDWLQQLLSRISIPLLLQRLILYGTTAAVLIMAAWVILRELRTVGPLATPGAARRGGGKAAPSGQRRLRPLTLTDVEQAAPAERSIVLLRLLVQALLQSGRLSVERALTYRELCEQSCFDDAAQRERFTRLARIAERDRYGIGSGAQVGLLQPAAVFASPAANLHGEGRALYEQLLEPRSRGTAAGGSPAAQPVSTRSGLGRGG